MFPSKKFQFLKLGFIIILWWNVWVMRMHRNVLNWVNGVKNRKTSNLEF